MSPCQIQRTNPSSCLLHKPSKSAKSGKHAARNVHSQLRPSTMLIKHHNVQTTTSPIDVMQDHFSLYLLMEWQFIHLAPEIQAYLHRGWVLLILGDIFRTTRWHIEVCLLSLAQRSGLGMTSSLSISPVIPLVASRRCHHGSRTSSSELPEANVRSGVPL
jgi:hypothetical protein